MYSTKNHNYAKSSPKIPGLNIRKNIKPYEQRKSMKLLLNDFQVGSKKEMNKGKQLRNRHKITDILILCPGFFV